MAFPKLSEADRTESVKNLRAFVTCLKEIDARRAAHKEQINKGELINDSVQSI